MKINLRILCGYDARAVLAKDKNITETCDLNSVAFDIDSEDKILDRILDLTKNTSGSWFNPVVNFTKKEMSQSRYFQLNCRKTIHETIRDYDLNFARLEALDYIHTTDHYKIKLLDQVALSRIKLKPNIVAGIDEWTAEFLITSTVAKIFKKEQLTGFTLKPIFNPKKDTHYEDYFMLYSESIMNSVEPDISIRGLTGKSSNEKDGARELGCLVYDLRERDVSSDFNRTAEDFSSNHMPLWGGGLIVYENAFNAINYVAGLSVR